jgi:hypothetical protein
MTSNELTINSLYQLLRDCTEFYPANALQCKQLQTFRVLQLERGEELATDNKGAIYADRDTVYFYSRAWNRAKQNPNKIVADFPILTAFELNSDAPKGVFSNGAKVCYSIEVAVLDVYKEDCQTKPNVCKNRSINQIFAETERILFGVMDYLSKCYLVSINGSDCPVLMSMYQIQAGVTDGSVSTYNIVYDIGNRLANENKSTRFTHVEMPTQRLYGTKTRLTFCVNNCNTYGFTGVADSVTPQTHLEQC